MPFDREDVIKFWVNECESETPRVEDKTFLSYFYNDDKNSPGEMWLRGDHDRAIKLARSRIPRFVASSGPRYRSVQYKKIHAARELARFHRMKNDPVFRAARKSYLKKYYEKKKQDSEWVAKRRARSLRLKHAQQRDGSSNG